MNTVFSLAKQLKKALSYTYYRNVDFLSEKKYLLKVRLYIQHDTFVQIYRNDIYDTTNLLLVVKNNRIYARDQIRGSWHRHSPDNPDTHDETQQGSKPISLPQFLKEVDKILHQKKII